MREAPPAPQSPALTTYAVAPRTAALALLLGLPTLAMLYLRGHALDASHTVLAPLLAHLDVTRLPTERLIAGAALFAALIAVIDWASRPHAVARPALAVLAALARTALASLTGVGVFYAARDRLNSLGDGPSLLRDPSHAVEQGGFYTFLDELGGMWLPVRIARSMFLDEAAPRPPTRLYLQAGYALVSFVCGALFVAALTATLRTRPARWPLATLLLVNAATLFFCGYVENYVVASTLVSAGFLYALEALRAGRASARTVYLTTACCALAVCFHGVACWSLFGLVALALATLAERPRAGLMRTVKGSLVAIALGLAILGVVYVAFTRWITPGVSFVHANRLHLATTPSAMLAMRPLEQHALAVARVATPALLVFAASLATHPRAVLARLRSRDALVAFALLLGFLTHQFVWPSTLGTAQDWDLFGFTWFALAYLATCAFEATEPPRWMFLVLFALTLVGGLSWPLRYATFGAAP